MKRILFPHLQKQVEYVYSRYPKAPKMKTSEIRLRTFASLGMFDKTVFKDGQLRELNIGDLKMDSVCKARRRVEKELRERERNKEEAKKYEGLPKVVKVLFSKI